jgi:hypothetical protein
MTFEEAYFPAMTIETQEEADRYLEKLVFAIMVSRPELTDDEARELARSNLGYSAAYFDHATRLRVERLFRCEHPILGKAGVSPLPPEECFRIGMEWAKEHISRREFEKDKAKRKHSN